MNTFSYRIGESGVDLTRAGLACWAMELANAFWSDPFAYTRVIKSYLS